MQVSWLRGKHHHRRFPTRRARSGGAPLPSSPPQLAPCCCTAALAELQAAHTLLRRTGRVQWLQLQPTAFSCTEEHQPTPGSCLSTKSTSSMLDFDSTFLSSRTRWLTQGSLSRHVCRCITSTQTGSQLGSEKKIYIVIAQPATIYSLPTSPWLLLLKLQAKGTSLGHTATDQSTGNAFLAEKFYVTPFIIPNITCEQIYFLYL